MSHQPFETWLLSEEPLDAAQQREFSAHLKECEDCRHLFDALAQVDQVFDASSNPAPTPGFSQRWLIRLSQSRQHRQVRRYWLFTLGLFLIAGLIFSTLILTNLSSVNWAYQLGQLIAGISLRAVQVRRLWDFFCSLTNLFPLIIPLLLIFGVGALSAMTVLIVTWFSAIIKLYQPSSIVMME